MVLPVTVQEVSVQESGVVDNDKKKRPDESIPYSEALERTKFGRFNYYIIILSGLVLSNVLLETSGVAFIMPVAQCDLGLTNFRKGLLSAIGYVGMILSSHLWGFLADTKGRRRVIRPTILASFVVTLFSSFATNFWLILILRLLNGFFISGGSATIYAYLGEFHMDRTRSRAMMGSAFIFALGAMCMPFLAFIVINQDWSFPLPFLGIIYKPWRLFIIVCGITGLFCGLSLYYLPESPKYLLSAKREEEAKQVLQKIYRINCGKDELKLPHLLPEDDCAEIKIAMKSSSLLKTFLNTMWNQTTPLFHKKYLRSTLIVCTTQFWIYLIVNGLYMWFPHIINSMSEFMNTHPGENKLLCQIVYDKDEFLYHNDGSMECTNKLEDTTFMYSLLMEILYASSFAFLGLIINRIGKITILFIIIVFFTSCGLVAVWLPYTPVAAIFYVLLFLVGVAINVLGAATVELYPTQLRAMAMCISLMMGRVGSVVGTNFVGALLSSYCELTFYISCFAMISCAFLILFLPKSIKDKTGKESNSNEC
ncbi:synaptic vesicle glycoprotein 2A-like isoform X2 [Glossina fuscipes]|uniref:Synaptic vesicle glycoprotein 2A-like isoform X2 n=1 Tax=Glossina fuscipes TaxID=7396 RepID=A0A9C5ZJT9_9MUSC|nr:synaptic vesicle glycoprotein 2A-like isoform X2 [Glossina fuscipes]